MYRVIDILNNTEIIINYGFKQGAKEGEEVRIVEKGTTIKDPKTNEVLGELNPIKDILEVYIVNEKFSICKKIKRSSYNSLNPLSKLYINEEKTLNLNVNHNDISNKKLESDDPIKIGDLVEVIK